MYPKSLSVPLVDNFVTVQNGTSESLFVPNIPQQISSKYILKNELGKGAYGTVYLGVDRFTGEELEFFSVLIGRVAVKRINDVFRTKTDAKRTLREITILRQCNHPNIAILKQMRIYYLISRDLIVPPDEFTYRNLWIIQVTLNRCG